MEYEDKKQVRDFLCGDCLVTFKIIIEPGVPAQSLSKAFLKSVKWLKQVEECPVCGSELTEE